MPRHPISPAKRIAAREQLLAHGWIASAAWTLRHPNHPLASCVFLGSFDIRIRAPKRTRWSYARGLARLLSGNPAGWPQLCGACGIDVQGNGPPPHRDGMTILCQACLRQRVRAIQIQPGRRRPHFRGMGKLLHAMLHTHKE